MAKPPIPNLKTSWRDETRAILNNRPAWLTLVKISEESHLPYAWLASFNQGDCDEPGVNRVQTLSAYLTERLK